MYGETTINPKIKMFFGQVLGLARFIRGSTSVKPGGGGGVGEGGGGM